MPPSSRFFLLDGGVGHILKSADPKGNLNFLGGALAPASAIREAHRKFVDAGCDVLTTATFGVTPCSLRKAGLSEGELEAITRRVARVAVEVAAEENERREKEREEGVKEETGGEGGGGLGRGRDRVLVAGCLPPLGENCYLPSSSSESSMSAVYERIAAALLEAGVDILLIETCSGSADAEAAAQGASAAAAAASSSPSSPSAPPPLWLSFTVDDEQPSRLRGGEGLGAAARRALESGGRGEKEVKDRRLPVSALLLNCSSPRALSAALPLLLRAVSESSRGEEEIGIGCYANGFRRSTTSWLRSEGVPPPPPPPAPSVSSAASAPAPAADEGERDYDGGGLITAEAYAMHASGWVRSWSCPRRGSSGGGGSEGGGGEKSSSSSFFVLGGCCGIGPEHIRAFRGLLDDSEEEEGPTSLKK